jgi:hypothetical protein
MSMTPTSGCSGPPISGRLTFHVIIDHTHRTFSIDGPDGPSGVRLHYQMLLVARKQNKKLKDLDIRAETREAALSEMQAYLSDYTFLGTWADAQSK